MGLPALSLDRHIEVQEGLRGGKPCLSGTRIAVADVVLMHLRLGNSLEEIAARFQLELPAVQEAVVTARPGHDGFRIRSRGFRSTVNQTEGCGFLIPILRVVVHAEDNSVRIRNEVEGVMMP